MADSSEHAQDYLKMKVADLKKELKARGLNTSGNKTELIDRLTAATINDPGKTGNISSEELIDDVLNEEDLEEEIEDVEEMEKSLDIDTSIIGTEETGLISPTLTTPAKKLKRKSSEVTDENNFVNKAPPKKIVLNRALAVNILQNKPEQNKEIKTLDNTKTVTKSDDDETTSQKSTNERRVIKLSNLTAKERLEMRAKKFGTPLTPEQKKLARQARFGLDKNSTVKTNSNVDTKIDVLKKRAERFGIVSSVMAKLDIQERLERRKARFGVVSATPVKKETKVK